MQIKYRSANRDEWEAFGNVVAYSHGDLPSTDEQHISWWESFFDETHNVAAFDENEIVGTVLSFTRETTVPGGATLAAALVTNVGVITTHKRQGIMTQMMKDLLQSAFDRGESISTLWSSESLIYGRLGYGMAGQHYIAKIKSGNVEIVRHPAILGRVRLSDRKRIREIGPDIWKRTAALHPGMPERTKFGWISAFGAFTDLPEREEALFFAVYEEDGKPEGYVAYSTSKTADDENDILLKELVAANDSAHAALWKFVLSIDLVGEVTDLYMPEDDSLWWMLDDPRQLKRTAYDAIWLRILDVERALSARTYGAECDLVIKVDDEFCPWVSGNYRLRVDGNGDGLALRSGADADVTLSAEVLATCYFGNAKFSELSRAGLAVENTKGSLATLDGVFASNREPWCPLMY